MCLQSHNIKEGEEFVAQVISPFSGLTQYIGWEHGGFIVTNLPIDRYFTSLARFKEWRNNTTYMRDYQVVKLWTKNEVEEAIKERGGKLCTEYDLKISEEQKPDEKCGS
jgi:hypothetical protein